MRQFQLLVLFGILASLTVSCANRRGKTASANNPYASNPYYTDSGSSATPSSAGSSQYPTYDDSAASPAPAAPSNNANPYPSYSGGSNSAQTYPDYTGGSSNSNPYPSSNSSGSVYGAPSSYSGGGGSSHTVASGENLYRISLRYGTSVSAIQAANNMGTSTTIHPGQVLMIP